MGDTHSYSWPALDQLLHGDDTTSLSGHSLSPSSSIMQTFYEDKEKDVRIGINHFNRFVVFCELYEENEMLDGKFLT